MKINIQSVHFDSLEHLNEFIETKVGKLEHFFDGIISADVVLSLDKAQNTENKVAKISLQVPNDLLVAEKQCKSFEEAIDHCCDALKRSIERYKATK